MKIDSAHAERSIFKRMLLRMVVNFVENDQISFEHTPSDSSTSAYSAHAVMAQSAKVSSFSTSIKESRQVKYKW